MTAIEDKAREALLRHVEATGEPEDIAAARAGDWRSVSLTGEDALAMWNAALNEAAKVARGGDTDGIDNFGARRMAQIIAEEIEAIKDTPSIASQDRGMSNG